MQLSSSTKNNTLRLEILKILLEVPNCELQSNEIEKKIMATRKDCKNERSLDVAFSRAKYALCAENLLKRKDCGHKDVFYLIPEKIRGNLKTELQKINNVQIFTKLDVDQQQKLLSEVEYYRRREQINALLKIPLPGFSVLSEIHKMGKDCKDFHPDHWKDVDFDYEAERYKVFYPELQGNADIELKLLSKADLVNPQMREEINKLQFGWRLLGISDAGIQLYCRLQLLGQKFNLQFEEEVQRWKDYYKMPDKEWTQMEAAIRENPSPEFINSLLGLPN
jgi:hypothetical protein